MNAVAPRCTRNIKASTAAATGLVRCAYCAARLHPAPAPATLLATRDHIAPKGRRQHISGLPGVRNFRWACKRCNGVRSMLGQCAGLMWLTLAEASHRRLPVPVVARDLLGARPA